MARRRIRVRRRFTIRGGLFKEGIGARRQATVKTEFIRGNRKSMRGFVSGIEGISQRQE